MSPYRSTLELLLRLVITVGVALLTTAAGAEPRPWAPQDSIEVQYIAPAPASPVWRVLPEGSQSAPINVSSDGAHFFFIRTWGDLESDADVCELSVYQTGAVQSWLASGHKVALAPYRRVQMRSRSSTMTSIEDATWDPDGRAVLFMGIGDDGSRELHRLDIVSGATHRITNHADQAAKTVDWFAARGRGVIYRTSVRRELPPFPYPGTSVDRRPDGSIWRDADLVVRNSTVAHYVVFGSGPTQQLASKADRLVSKTIRFSPEGNHVVGGVFWRDQQRVVGEIVLVDLQTAKITPLANLTAAGLGSATYPGTQIPVPATEAFWSADGTRVILSNAIVPKSASDQSEEAAPALIEYEIATGRYKVLESLIASQTGGSSSLISAVRWLKQGEELLVSHHNGTQPGQGTVFSFTSAGVQRRAIEERATASLQAQGGLPSNLAVRLTENANTPPRVVISGFKREAALTQPDPALHNVAFARMESFQWQESPGKTATGGLTLPIGSSRGQPLPLVIQAYYYKPDAFLPDGPHRAIDAAQALAARGMAVLQIGLPHVDRSKGGALGSEFVARIESAVRALARDGVVDPSKVALSGWHSAGTQTIYAITHTQPDRIRLAAAVAANSGTGSYGEYLVLAGGLGTAAVSGYEAGRGGRFWQNEEQWLKEDPIFNADRVQTPLLITQHGNTSGLSVRDNFSVIQLIGAFLINNKSVDYLYLPNGGHQLVRPLERLASIDGVVDWMSFWLQQYEDPSPHKARLYERWRPMRQQQVIAPDRLTVR